MKRRLTYPVLLVLVGALLIGLWSPALAKTKDGNYLFLYAGGNVYGDWAVPVKKGMEDAAKMLGNVEWRWVGPTTNEVPKIIDAGWSVVNDPEADGLILDIYDPVSHEELIQAGKDRGMSVITMFGDDPDSARDGWVGYSPVDSGHQIAYKLLPYLDEGDHVAICYWGPQEHQILQSEATGEILEQNGITWEPLSVGTQDPLVAEGVLTGYLTAHPEVDGIIAQSGIEGAGLAFALRKMGRKDLKVAGGGNMVPASMEAVRDGIFDLVWDGQIYLVGFYAIMAGYHNVTIGHFPPPRIDPGFVFVDQDNYEAMKDLIAQRYF